MGKPLVYEGSITQGERPDWGPLLDAVDEQLTDDFMWMFEVLLANGTPLQAYKHRMTRRYVHLDPAGAAFAYEPPDRYRSYPVAEILEEVFAPLRRNPCVTDAQVRASWAAVDRLSGT